MIVSLLLHCYTIGVRYISIQEVVSILYVKHN